MPHGNCAAHSSTSFPASDASVCVSFSGLYGHLSEHNRPTADNNLLLFPDDAAITTMHGKPYMEISAGIDNIFRLFRVDYVWRLSYLDVPYSIDRHGLRVAMHFTF